MTAAVETRVPSDHEPLALHLPELLEVIAEVTQNDEELAATLLHMVETRRVRLLTPLAV